MIYRKIDRINKQIQRKIEKNTLIDSLIVRQIESFIQEIRRSKDRINTQIERYNKYIIAKMDRKFGFKIDRRNIYIDSLIDKKEIQRQKDRQ